MSNLENFKTKESVKSLYFAYGSNLNPLQMQYRCPGSKALTVGCLNHYKLDFTRYSKTRNGGVADVVPAKDHSVWGLVWELSEPDLSSLDDFEGVPEFYVRNKMEISMVTGEIVRAWMD